MSFGCTDVRLLSLKSKVFNSGSSNLYSLLTGNNPDISGDQVYDIIFIKWQNGMDYIQNKENFWRELSYTYYTTETLISLKNLGFKITEDENIILFLHTVKDTEKFECFLNLTENRNEADWSTSGSRSSGRYWPLWARTLLFQLDV